MRFALVKLIRTYTLERRYVKLLIFITMRISKELHQAIVSTTNTLLDTSYTPEEINKIAFDARLGGYFDVYKRVGRVGHMIVASTACETVRAAHQELSEEISQVLQNSRHEQLLYSED